MNLARSSLGSTLRLMLATLLLLASLAGARMQGQMAGGMAFAAAVGELCSGQPAPDSKQLPSGQAAHDHCVLCHMPVGSAPGLPCAAHPQQHPFAFAVERTHSTGQSITRPSYQSRAPPSLSA